MIFPTLRVGQCGEYAAASVLSLFSPLVNVVPHGSHADIIFEYKKNIYKCQVKTCQLKKMCHKTHKRVNWCFDMRRTTNCKERRYKKGMVDLYAFYCLQHNKTIFKVFDETPTKITFTDKEFQEVDTVKDLEKVLKHMKK